MSRTNEICYVSWHETCTCKCRLDASAFNLMIDSAGIVVNTYLFVNNWLINLDVVMGS